MMLVNQGGRQQKAGCERLAAIGSSEKVDDLEQKGLLSCLISVEVSDRTFGVPDFSGSFEHVADRRKRARWVVLLYKLT